MAGSGQRLHGLRSWARLVGRLEDGGERSQDGFLLELSRTRQCSCRCDQGDICRDGKAPEIKVGSQVKDDEVEVQSQRLSAAPTI